MTSNGQFFPVATVMEVLGERWTLLVVRELLAGSGEDRSWDQALADGSLVVEGTTDVRRALPRWVGQGTFAAVAR